MTSQQLALGVKLRDDARFDNFHGDRNAAAAERLKEVCQPSRAVPVVVLCGDSDTGKSHLLQAVCHLAEYQGRNGICVSMEELLPLGADALAGLDSQWVICLDDLDLIAGRERWEETVFHLYNRVNDRGGMMVVSLSETPSAVPFQLPDLVSRLHHGLTIQLGINRDHDRLKILTARAEQRGLDLGSDVAAFILRRAPRGLADLLAMLDRLDDNSLRAQRRLTIPFIKTVMGW